MLRPVLIVVGAFAGLAALFFLSGFLLPREHRAEADARIEAKPEALWALITDMVHTPGWLGGVAKVEAAPPENGLTVWKQTGTDDSTLFFVTRKARPPDLLVREVRDPGGAFGGTWTIQLRDQAGVTRVSIVEDGWIGIALFRPVQRFIVGFDTTMKAYLADLKRAAEAKHGA